ncbi:MAG: hypothetical protein V4444_03740 [Pseudomonadota bacterium]
MMTKLIRLADQLARARQHLLAARLAERLSSTIKGASVTVEETRVVVRGRGLIKRWLIDPELRFLSGDHK